MNAILTLDVNRIRSVCWGTQVVAKFRDGQERANTVRVYVCCIRLRSANTDIVISFNSPQWVSADSSSAKHIDAERMAHVNTAEVAESAFRAITDSFKIFDMGLFVN